MTFFYKLIYYIYRIKIIFFVSKNIDFYYILSLEAFINEIKLCNNKTYSIVFYYIIGILNRLEIKK